MESPDVTETVPRKSATRIGPWVMVGAVAIGAAFVGLYLIVDHVAGEMRERAATERTARIATMGEAALFEEAYVAKNLNFESAWVDGYLYAASLQTEIRERGDVMVPTLVLSGMSEDRDRRKFAVFLLSQLRSPAAYHALVDLDPVGQPVNIRQEIIRGIGSSARPAAAFRALCSQASSPDPGIRRSIEVELIRMARARPGELRDAGIDGFLREQADSADGPELVRELAPRLLELMSAQSATEDTR